MKIETGLMELTHVLRRLAGRFGLGALVLLGCLGASPTAARADIWTFNDVNFYAATWSPTGTVYTEVASLSGSFSTNSAVTQVTDFSDLKLTGDSDYVFSIAGMVDDYLPGTIGIYTAGWTSYIDLYLTSPLTGASSSYSISSGYDCPGCAVLLPNSHANVGTGAKISDSDIKAAPEPGFYAVLAFGLSALLFAAWRRRRA